MEGRGPETSQGTGTGRGLDLLVWGLTIAGMVAVAAGVAYVLSSASFSLPEIAYRDETVDFELIPVAPAEESPLAEAPVAEVAAAPERSAAALVRWARQPMPDYPWQAADRGIEQGEVVLMCAALVSGRLDACEVVEETPPGAGFGEAALASTRDARVTPRTVDGAPGDGSVRFTIRFRMAP